jgi:hypothetical protein
VGHSEDGRITSMKNSSDIIENGTRDLPGSSEVLLPTTLPQFVTVVVVNVQQLSATGH